MWASSGPFGLGSLCLTLGADAVEESGSGLVGEVLGNEAARESPSQDSTPEVLSAQGNRRYLRGKTITDVQ
ncbi:hypothetical protein CWI85_25760 [Streptomyces albidoflavus]|nr:hypothetical protein CWI85_25760 [Streptomyces albidoflavus]